MYPFYDDEKGILELTENEFISVDDFELMFGNDHNFNYNYLYNHDMATERWKLIFNEWKQKGILN